jgi:hypothetical protein
MITAQQTKTMYDAHDHVGSTERVVTSLLSIHIRKNFDNFARLSRTDFPIEKLMDCGSLHNALPAKLASNPKQSQQGASEHRLTNNTTPTNQESIYNACNHMPENTMDRVSEAHKDKQ